MDRIGARLARDPQDVRNIEVGLDGALALADQIGLIGLGAMQAEAVFLRIDRDRLDVELVGRAHDADGDLAAIGDQQPPNPLEHAHDLSWLGWLDSSRPDRRPDSPRSCRGARPRWPRMPAVTPPLLLQIRAGARAPAAGDCRECALCSRETRSASAWKLCSRSRISRSSRAEGVRSTSSILSCLVAQRRHVGALRMAAVEQLADALHRIEQLACTTRASAPAVRRARASSPARGRGAPPPGDCARSTPLHWHRSADCP